MILWVCESQEQAASIDNGKHASSPKCIKQTSWWICRRRTKLSYEGQTEDLCLRKKHFRYDWPAEERGQEQPEWQKTYFWIIQKPFCCLGRHTSASGCSGIRTRQNGYTKSTKPDRTPDGEAAARAEPAHSSARSRRSGRPARPRCHGSAAASRNGGGGGGKRRAAMVRSECRWEPLSSPRRGPFPPFQDVPRSLGTTFPLPTLFPFSATPTPLRSPSPLPPPLLSSPGWIIWFPSFLVITPHFISPSTAQGCACLPKRPWEAQQWGGPGGDPSVCGEVRDGMTCVWA